MARRSRSKQRGKGVGSRSQSAGKSKGGSRSSAGSKGGSKSGGNRSGSGARGNRSSSKSTTSSKSKSTTSSKKKSLTGRARLQALGRAPTSPRDSVAAKRFREREAAGLSGLTGGPKVNQYLSTVLDREHKYRTQLGYVTITLKLNKQLRKQLKKNKQDNLTQVDCFLV